MSSPPLAISELRAPFDRRYTGTRGTYTYTMRLERNPQCAVCSPGVSLRMSAECTLQDVLDRLQKDYPERLLAPSVSYGSASLYMRGVLEESTRGNLGKTMEELLVRRGRQDRGKTLGRQAILPSRVASGRGSALSVAAGGVLPAGGEEGRGAADCERQEAAGADARAAVAGRRRGYAVI